MKDFPTDAALAHSFHFPNCPLEPLYYELDEE